MPDLLTHVLVVYCLVRVASWRYHWLRPPFVTVAMAGAMIPDLTKLGLLLPSSQVQSLLNFPFSWFSFHTIGGVILSVLIGTAIVPVTHRLRVGALLTVGAISHLFLDALLMKPSGLAAPMVWPLTWYRPPTPGIYTSVDLWPTGVALSIAAVVWWRSSRRNRHQSE